MKTTVRSDLQRSHARGMALRSLKLMPVTIVSTGATLAMLLLEITLLHARWWPVAVLGAFVTLLHAGVAVSLGVFALGAVRDLLRTAFGRPKKMFTHEMLERAIEQADSHGDSQAWRLSYVLAVATPFFPVAMFAVSNLLGWYRCEEEEQMEFAPHMASPSGVYGADDDDPTGWTHSGPEADIVGASRKVLSAVASRTFDLAGAT